MTHSIRTNKFNNPYDNLVKSLGDFTWSEIRDFFTCHEEAANKDQVALFNMVRYRENDLEWKEGLPLDDQLEFLPDTGEVVSLRRNINILQVDALVLDYDGGITLDELKHRFRDYEYLGYTSYNHLKDGSTHKCRLIFPLSCPIPVNAKIDSLPTYEDLKVPLGEFAGPCDPVVFKPNQMYFIPATHPDRMTLAVTWVNRGKILDWTQWNIADCQRPR